MPAPAMVGFRTARVAPPAGRRLLPGMVAVAAVLFLGNALYSGSNAGAQQIPRLWTSTGQAIAVADHNAVPLSMQGPATTFVSGTGSARSLLNRRRIDDDSEESLVVMQGSSKRNNKYYKPKKIHFRYHEALDRKNSLMCPYWLQKLTIKKDPTLEKWSQTLKLTFPEGEDDVVTEEEVMEYFTTDEYKPEAVIVGHLLPHDPLKHAYVHFGTNEECIKARKEKDGGSIGKASEVKVVYTDEKKWIRLRDGVSLSGPKRAMWMKAYGNQAYPEMGIQGWVGESAARDHPVYPE
mmetsp:Transcript_18440/g.50623  ORF Transcript_18440/g.50623 Transcript_18440/m.50623 type:complete len:293 (-) Transcript_18440:142-1020(-)